MRRTLLVLALLTAMLIAPIVVRAQQGAELRGYTADARAARIAALREQYSIVLTSGERQLVVGRCRAAQGSLQTISSDLSAIVNKRDGIYSDAITSLIQLKYRLTVQQIDTSNLDLLIVDYQQKKAVFDSMAEDYAISLEDAETVDCRQSPEDFRAAIEGVRAARKPVIDAAAQISDLTKSNLKTTFDALSLRLQTGGISGK